MGWRDPPQAGETWRKRENGKQETRFVVDRTLGGDVLYDKGRERWHHRCTESEWKQWVDGAKRLR